MSPFLALIIDVLLPLVADEANYCVLRGEEKEGKKGGKEVENNRERERERGADSKGKITRLFAGCSVGKARGKFGMHRSLLRAANSHLWNYPDD